MRERSKQQGAPWILTEVNNYQPSSTCKHAIEEQSQCLEESQRCFESTVAEGVRFTDLHCLIEQLRRD